MKRLITIFTCLLTLTVLSCDQDNDSPAKKLSNSSTETELATRELCTPGTIGSIQVDSISAEDGYIMSIWEGKTNRKVTVSSAEGLESRPLMVGKRIWLGLDGVTYYRSILSFDTSGVPDCPNARIVNILLNVTPNGEDIDDFSYLGDNLDIEIAGAAGFSGSYALTSSDYSAASAAKVSATWDLLLGGLDLHFNPDFTIGGLAPYINRTGKTQLRLTTRSHPENKYVFLYGWDFFRSHDFPRIKPNLGITWIIE